MKEFTNVRILGGPPYTFKIENYPDYVFECEYDGTDVAIEFIYDKPTNLYEHLKIVHGLLDERSNFRKQLFREFSYIKNKRLRSIYFECNAYPFFEYPFRITLSSNISEIVRECYREHGYWVNDNDTEKDIEERLSNAFKLESFLRKRYDEEVDTSDIFTKYKNTICFNEKDEKKKEEELHKALDERFNEYLRCFDISKISSFGSDENLAQLFEYVKKLWKV